MPKAKSKSAKEKSEELATADKGGTLATIDNNVQKANKLLENLLDSVTKTEIKEMQTKHKVDSIVEIFAAMKTFSRTLQTPTKQVFNQFNFQDAGTNDIEALEASIMASSGFDGDQEEGD